MIINDETTTMPVPFENLESGVVFKFGDYLYMRIPTITDHSTYETFNAIRLEDMLYMTFGFEDEVHPVKATLTVTY